MIKSWSFRRLTDFETCKHRAFLLHHEKAKEPPRQLKPGQTEHANDRGTRIHTAAEDFVKSPTPIELIPELSDFREEFEMLRALYAQGRVALEGEWGFDESWAPVDWWDRNVWARIKLDAKVQLEPTHAVVIDYKTGKKSGNEVKHHDQMTVYQLATFLRYPDLEKVTVELWYPDVKDLTRQVYTRAQGLKHLKTVNKRALALTTATEFPPNPNQHTCRFCYLGAKGSGVCKVGL